MKQASSLLALIPALALGAPAAGQLVIDNTQPGTYMDISATGTPLSLSDDGEVDITTTVGNTLLAAGTARVGANGAVRFDGNGQSLGFTNGTIPSLSAFSGDQTLMPFWDDIDINSGMAGEIYWQEIAGVLIVQWQDAEFFPGGGDTTTFQLQVHSTGPIFAQYLYQDVMQPRADGGGSATIGYQGRMCTGKDVLFSFNTQNAVVDGDVLSIMGTIPPPPQMNTFTIVDTLPGTYVDISASGMPLSLCDDCEVDITTTVGNAVLGAGTVRVGANGGVRFMGSAQSLGFGNGSLPSTNAFSAEQTLLPFWDDIDIDSGADGEIYWQEIGGTLIIQWQDAAFFPGGGDTATFQLQVFSEGSTIAQFLYEDIMQARPNGGESATIGYQGRLCVDNTVQYSFNTPGSVADGDVLSLVPSLIPIGTTYCVSIPNSSGNPALIQAGGSTSVADQALTLIATDLPSSVVGIFYYGTSQTQVPFGDGFRCVSGANQRLPFNSADASGTMIEPDLFALPMPNVPIAPGTLNFQGWFRDPAGPGGTGFNLTDGASVTFVP